MANRIMLNETSYHGAGAIKEIATEAKARAFKKAFVCSDPDLIKFGVTKKVTDILDENGLAYEIYSDIKANPTIENVQHGVEAFKKADADYIVAIGGGSSMDTSKAIGIIIANPEALKVLHRQQNLVYQSSQFQQQPEQLLRLQSTTLSQMLKERENSFVLTHMTCRLSQLLTRI